MDAVHVGAVPEHAPLQPVKVEPGEGVAVSVTAVPAASAALHAGGQAIAAGELTTVPPPAVPTASANRWDAVSTKCAVTDLAAFTVSAHVPVPLQPPVQPANDHPVDGAAVRATLVPVGNSREHAAPQSIPAGELVTVPLPVLPTTSVNDVCVPVRSNTAPTTTESVGSIVQVSCVPEQASVQPLNTEPESGVAVRVIGPPPGSSLPGMIAAQVGPQSM